MGWFDLDNIHWLGVLLATLSAFAVGGIWYSPRVFGTGWMSEVGLTPEGIEANPPSAATWAKVATMAAVTAIGLNLVLVAFEVDTTTAGALAGGTLAVLFRGTTHFIHNGFAQRSDKLSFIDTGHDIAAMAVAGAILGAFL